MDVVSAEWLWTEIAAGSPVVVLDCRFDLSNPAAGQAAYAAGHLPQAHYCDLDRDLSGLRGRFGGRHPLPAPEMLAQKLRRIGVRQGVTQVVAYDASRLAFAARLWWLLRYLGHDPVAVLNGGWHRWQSLGYPITTELPAIPQSPSTFVPKVRHDWVVDYATVRDRPAHRVLIDAREGERYRGEWEPIDPVAGHIPGAVNYCWRDITDDQGCLRHDHGDRWQFLSAQQPPMVYCGSGVTACVNLLSLHLAGIERAQLYAGSWSDWCAHLG
jgi:thiosulfate/3-mercaptopyruvate sulfurtransferase